MFVIPQAVQFGAMDKAMVRFIKDVLHRLLLDHPEETVEAVFARIAPLTKLQLLQEGLKLFMQHFLIRKLAKDAPDRQLLVDRVALAEKALNSAQSKVLM
jgi:hypothetical protein